MPDGMTPAANLLEEMDPSGTVAAVWAKEAESAKATGVNRWSGVSTWEPLVPSLNQTRRYMGFVAVCPTALENTLPGRLAIFKTEVSPKTTPYRPFVTGTDTAALGSPKG
jgi:hypothetical protein